MTVDNINPRGDRFVFPDIHCAIVLDSGRLLNWGAPLASFLTSFLSVLAQQDWCLPLAIRSVKSFAWHLVPF